MSDPEGVIKFKLHWEETNLPPFDLDDFNHWRVQLKEAGLIGVEDGIGFGNISIRLDQERFLITGTQTGHLESLTENDFAIVTQVHLETNELWAEGPAKPSAESMTHAAVYQASPQTGAVIHGHHQKLWDSAHSNWLITPPDLTYGTPAMAEAVITIAKQAGGFGHLAMEGHEGGVLVWATGLEQASKFLQNQVATLSTE